MNNPFQDQLLKAGLVTKEQVQKARKSQNKKQKQQRSKKEKAPDESTIKAQQASKEKARVDRELNRKKQEASRKKAISAEINQLITQNRIERADDCDIAYNFEHLGKIKRIYVNKELRQKIIQGKSGIARIDGRYELVPKDIAEKIHQRNDKRVVLIEADTQQTDENDPYADYQIPDDLTW
jgi:uncharacterized protein YaiL (DUF2058 family)